MCVPDGVYSDVPPPPQNPVSVLWCLDFDLDVDVESESVLELELDFDFDLELDDDPEVELEHPVAVTTLHEVIHPTFPVQRSSHGNEVKEVNGSLGQAQR